MNLDKNGLVIIGNGIAGITAARKLRQLHPKIRIRIISSESDLFFSRTALMYIYMGHMSLKDTQAYPKSFFAKKNRLELIKDHVDEIHIEAKELKLRKQAKIEYDFLLLASGAKYNKFGWPGQDSDGVQGLYSLQDLELLEKNTSKHKVNHAVIVGGGLIGIELAEMLHVRGIKTTMLVREKNYWNNVLPLEESQMINEEIREHHLDLRLETELKEILADKDGRATGVITSRDEKIECQLVGLTAGVSPRIELIKNSTIETQLETQRGILVDSHMQTTNEYIFAAGDCAQLRNADASPGPVEQLWYTGRTHGSVAARFIAKQAYKADNKNEQANSISAEPYNRGTHFNSAKFFTIEYQTYGQVAPKIKSEETFIWQDKKAKKLIRLLWDASSPEKIITGMNFLGTRYRQNVCTEWIEKKKSLEYVVKHLAEASFDPELCKPSYRSFQKAFKVHGPL